MTGIELALAIVPLVIAAAEHHKRLTAGIKAIGSRKKKDEQQLEFFWDLYDELSLLDNTLNIILQSLPSHNKEDRPLKLTDEERQMLDDFLGNRADPFHSILTRLLTGLENIVSDKSIDIDPEEVVISSPQLFLVKLERFQDIIRNGVTTKTLSERFRFTRNERSRRRAMEKIRDGNKKLERLLRGSLTADASKAIRTTKAKPHRIRLRRLSAPLYNKFADKWPSTCGCHCRHEARLCLWNCCSEQRHNEPDAGDSVDILVSVPEADECWQEIKVVIPPDRHDDRTVQFVSNEPFQAEPITPGRVAQDIDSESLCDVVNSAYARHIALQLIFDEGKLWKSPARRTSLGIQKQKDVNLNELLSDSRQKISLKEQWTLAVVLAHAALHSLDRPWLDRDWNKGHIYFFRKDISMEADLGRPFLRVQFDDQNNSDEAIDESFSIHSCPRLLALGILLLEIYLKERIESRWSESDLMDDGQPNENTNLTTALRLLDDSEGEVYEGYRRAIQACLEFEMTESGAEELRKKVYEEVVLPLEQELEHGFHVRPEDLSLVR